MKAIRMWCRGSGRFWNNIKNVVKMSTGYLTHLDQADGVELLQSDEWQDRWPLAFCGWGHFLVDQSRTLVVGKYRDILVVGTTDRAQLRVIFQICIS